MAGRCGRPKPGRCTTTANSAAASAAAESDGASAPCIVPGTPGGMVNGLACRNARRHTETHALRLPHRHQAPQPRRHRRPREGRRPRDAARGRHGRRRLGQAADRRRVVVERDHPVQPVAGPAGQGRQGRGVRRGRLPAGVRHHLGVRRHLDGPRGHALLAGLPRGDRRQRRDRDAGRTPRRLGAAGRLRQVAARHADGRRPARPGERVPLRRLDPARHGQAVRRHRDAKSRSSTRSRRSARARAG